VGVRLLAAAVLPLAGACLLLGGAPPVAAGARAHMAEARALAAAATTTPVTAPLQSAELWATVNVCNSSHHPDTIGIRGSMPGDGHAHDVMYMRFLVQSLDASTGKWADIGRSADSGFIDVGSAAATRQAGRTFEFKPTASDYTLRGMVEFQWHRGGHTESTTTRTTTAHHSSAADAEPKGFSAATCTLP